MKKKIGLLEIKAALKDPRFRDSLPLEARDGVIKYLDNPGCACNVPFYRTLLKDYKQHVLAYFPNADVVDEQEEMKKLAENNFDVINCSINDLAARLKALPPGRKQIQMARFEDQVTVIVNELEYF